ncbi:hypothetical protein [Streptomyces demainii]|uniref:Transcriptional regulator n=1 Tax=Streptomyces demainii TaxID=588122 RepID=A0ABT9KT07_9ACTN|nr:hypothetical protein [Streptomyces demainii]MDP9611573.1 transcriptional regulator [Streptomyces demainii]
MTAEETAKGNTLVGIYKARRDGLTQADIALMLGGVAASGIAAKEAKGAEIHRERERRKSTDE